MHERGSPRVPDHLRAYDDVSELPRQALGDLVKCVDREGECVGGLVDPEMLLLQRAALVEPKPSRVRNICIGSGEVFCASSRMTKLSFSVRPRMKASGATSIVPRSMYVLSFSGSIVS